MRITPCKLDHNAEISVLPMINVVFLLLIFFMLAGVVAAPDPEGFTPVQSTQADPQTPRDRILVVAADGTLFLDGVQLAADRLSTAVDRERDSLTLRADAALPAERLIDIMIRLGDLGLDRIELLTEHRKP